MDNSFQHGAASWFGTGLGFSPSPPEAAPSFKSAYFCQSPDTKKDFTQNGQRYELIMAVNGYHPILDYRRALSPSGIYVALGGSMTQIIQGMLLGPLVSGIGGKKMGFMGIAKSNQKDLVYIGELLKAGKVVPVIERFYPLILQPHLGENP